MDGGVLADALGADFAAAVGVFAAALDFGSSAFAGGGAGVRVGR